MIAQRITSYQQQFETRLTFTPSNFRHSAGLCCYYNTRHFYALGLTYEESRGIVLELTGADKKYQEFLEERLPVASHTIYMRMSINQASVQFYYSKNGNDWTAIGPALDFGKISDDYAEGYTGAMAALFAQDLMYETNWADFDYFKIDNMETNQ